MKELCSSLMRKTQTLANQTWSSCLNVHTSSVETPAPMPINVCIAELAPDMLQQSFAAATIPKQPPLALLPSTRAATTLSLASLAWHPKGDGLEESRANGETAKPIVTGVAAWAEPHNTAVATAEGGAHSVIRIARHADF